MTASLHDIAQQMVTPGKGILASDERGTSLNKKFAPLGIAQTGEMRRAYRELLITTPGIEQYLTGMILSEETMQHTTHTDIPFPHILQQKGILPGVKVDGGTIPLTGFPGERITEGLDRLAEKVQMYTTLGAVFAKWRAVIVIDDKKELPSDTAIVANAHVLARYAAICQENGLVPIVEPEVLHDGTHTLDHCADVTTHVLREVFSHLPFFGVDLGAMILKTSMVLPGKDATPATPEEVAAATVQVLKETVPHTVPGVVFLSGGQSPEEATQNLNAIAHDDSLPWEISFSYLRAIQQPALDAWGGKEENKEAARAAFIQQLEQVACAEQGHYPDTC